MIEMQCVSSERHMEAVMMLSEIPSPQKERDTQMLSVGHNEPGNKPELMGRPTPKDRLMLAGVSLIMLFFLAVMTFGATSMLHTGYIGWIAILAMICFAIVTINIVLILSGSHMNRLHEQSPSSLLQ
jgi:hypothetical protein